MSLVLYFFFFDCLNRHHLLLKNKENTVLFGFVILDVIRRDTQSLIPLYN